MAASSPALNCSDAHIYGVKRSPLKKFLYWCPECNLPLLGKMCGCGAEGIKFALLQPYDVRPALGHDMILLKDLLDERFGTDTLQNIVLFNKTGGADRTDLIIMNGVRFGWLRFDPCERRYSLEITFDALPFLLETVQRGIVDISAALPEFRGKRIGGKRLPVKTDEPDGCVIVQAGDRYGVGILAQGWVRIRQFGRVEPRAVPDPDWDTVINANSRHLKNLERNAVRVIRRHTRGERRVNISFSGGKDSTAVLELARRAGVSDAYFIDTGMEFPETIAFVQEAGIQNILRPDTDFWEDLRTLGPPRKDDRWCCERLKLEPVKQWLKEGERCMTIQGNRRYESFSRAEMPEISKNPYNVRQTNLSPILNWRALDVFLYIWWRNLPCNPLYSQGFERVGCWMCPAMLESEYDRVRICHPDLHRRWSEFLDVWARRNGVPKSHIRCGMWRWKHLPPKMKELLSQKKTLIASPFKGKNR
jgi:3'-phosphoadenosine 5'-phosphosulfate sulfotransferase (PAPS reductase)/FAD synthetase/predicted RNA-binding protein with PUA domain